MPAGNRRLHIVITAGPTREYLDSVRFISNASSGKMGYAIAAAARDAGHHVTLVSGPVEIDPPAGVKTIQVVSATQMAAATKRAFRAADAAIFAAAVSDYRPRRRAAKKMPKHTRERSIAMVPTTDIAASLGKIKGRRVTIGFALEDHDGWAHAVRKLREKRFDAIVLNRPEAIGAERVAVEFCYRGQWERWPAAKKQVIAARIIRRLASWTETENPRK